MSKSIAPLNSDKHFKSKIIESTDYRRFAEQHLIPVVFHEFHHLASEFPLVFVKNTETGQFIPVALMGIKNGVNLYCQQDNWQPIIRPLGFNNAPLSLVKTNEQSEDVMVCIDEDSELVVSNDGHRLFKDNKEQSDYLKARTQALLDIASYRQQTANICQFLASKELFTAKQLSVKLLKNEQTINIDGVYIVDEKLLNRLSDEEFLVLKNKGLLSLIYAHIISLQQLPRLIEKQNQYDKSQ
ncbi:SapC family protein [Shewanella gelidimarina]|uniref:SapC family protein n=1 Tax=Shewanella gelidimarina TaxID=56813 RepID=UPI00200FA191|nr:SapC family protein [Shewanella gelidimarina]MCL1056991.1 SapC family protein [Shewanella gelidimarina]